MKSLVQNYGNTHNATKVFVFLVLLFIGLSTFFALKLKRGIIPDEIAHHTLSAVFSTTWGIPADSADTYAYGYLEHKPFLYYWLNGRVLNVLNLFSPSLTHYRKFVALRFISVFYSTITLIFCYLLSKEIINNIGLWKTGYSPIDIGGSKTT